MVYMGSQKSSGDHSLRVVFNEGSHGGLRFSSFARRYTVMNQTTRSTRPPHRIRLVTCNMATLR